MIQANRMLDLEATGRRKVGHAALLVSLLAGVAIATAAAVTIAAFPAVLVDLQAMLRIAATNLAPFAPALAGVALIATLLLMRRSRQVLMAIGRGLRQIAAGGMTALLPLSENRATRRQGPALASEAIGYATPRMLHVAEVLDDQAQMQAEMDRAIVEGMGAVSQLIAQHEQTRGKFEAKLNERLRPALEYADTLDANLDRLMARLKAAGTEPDAALAAQFQRDRESAMKVREQAERSKAPLRGWLDRESAAMDALLAAFDSDVAVIEKRIAEQRRDLARIATGLRSDDLGMALGFMQERLDEARSLADAGVTDIAAVEATLRPERALAQGTTSSHLGAALAVLGWMSASPAPAPPRETIEAVATRQPITRATTRLEEETSAVWVA